MEVRAVIKILGTKRKGALLNDALIAIIIVIAAIIPVAATIQYAYSSIVSSQEISDRFNEFGDKVDELIWNQKLSQMTSPDYADYTNYPLSALSKAYDFEININGATISADMTVFQDTLRTHSGRRNTQVRVFLLRQP